MPESSRRKHRPTSHDRDREREHDRHRRDRSERSDRSYKSTKKSKSKKSKKYSRRSSSSSSSSSSYESYSSSRRSKTRAPSSESSSRNSKTRPPSVETENARLPAPPPKEIDLTDSHVQKALATIEEDKFEIKSFFSTRDREAPVKNLAGEKVVIDLNSETVQLPKHCEIEITKEQIFHLNFLGDPHLKTEKWIRKLYNFRQKNLVN